MPTFRSTRPFSRYAYSLHGLDVWGLRPCTTTESTQWCLHVICLPHFLPGSCHHACYVVPLCRCVHWSPRTSFWKLRLRSCRIASSSRRASGSCTRPSWRSSTGSQSRWECRGWVRSHVRTTAYYSRPQSVYRLNYEYVTISAHDSYVAKFIL